MSPPAGVAAGRRAATKQANREAILAAGRQVFAELGYGAATVRDVVRRTDLAAGTFYNHFPDKEAVLRAVLEDAAREARARTRAARQEARTLDGFVRDGFRAYFTWLAGEPETFALVRRNAGAIRALFDDPAIWAGARELAEDLRAAIAAGIVPAHDADAMAVAMIGTGFELAVRLVDRDPPDVEGAVDFATELFVGGLERLGRTGRDLGHPGAAHPPSRA